MSSRTLCVLVTLALGACSGGGTVPRDVVVPPPTPKRTPTFLFWGQSNMEGSAALDDLPGILDVNAVDPGWLRFYQNNLTDFRPDVGRIVPLDFAPERYENLLLTPYAMPIHLSTPGYGARLRRFGLELGTVYRLAELLQGPALHIKLAVGGTTVAPRPVSQPDYPGDWYWVCAHKSWHPSLPKSTAPFTAAPVDGGTSLLLGAGLMYDPAKNWAPNAHRLRFVTSGGSFGLIAGNSGNALQVPIWMPVEPPPGPYVIEQRTFEPASLLRTMIEDYVGAAAALEPIDVRGVFIAIGESDATQLDTALLAGGYLGDCITWMREQLVRDGRTTLQANELPVVVVQLKEIATWQYAAEANAGFRRMAASMPNVVAIDGSAYPYGGADGADIYHYNARGAIDLGRAMADAWAALRR